LSQNSSSFPRSSRSKTAESEFSLKNGRFAPSILFCGGIFMGYHHQHHKGEDLVKIHPAVAEQLRHYRKKEKI